MNAVAPSPYQNRAPDEGPLVWVLHQGTSEVSNISRWIAMMQVDCSDRKSGVNFICLSS